MRKTSEPPTATAASTLRDRVLPSVFHPAAARSRSHGCEKERKRKEGRREGGKGGRKDGSDGGCSARDKRRGLYLGLGLHP